MVFSILNKFLGFSQLAFNFIILNIYNILLKLHQKIRNLKIIKWKNPKKPVNFFNLRNLVPKTLHQPSYPFATIPSATPYLCQPQLPSSLSNTTFHKTAKTERKSGGLSHHFSPSPPAPLSGITSGPPSPIIIL
ncbi:hypothetical protein V6Z12_A12G003200 [Gossypium hirsutum]